MSVKAVCHPALVSTKGTLVPAERDRDVAPDPTDTENSLTLGKSRLKSAGSPVLSWASLLLA